MSEIFSENQSDLNIETQPEEQGAADQKLTDEYAEKPEWYVIHTYSGYENKVKDTLEKSIKSSGMENYIFDVCVPEQEVTEKKRGKLVKTTRKIFPGYVLVHMINTQRSWFIVRNTRGVTGFVGVDGQPTPLTAEEIDNMLNPKQLEAECDLAIGETVIIKEGQFIGQQGEIVDIDKVLSKVLVKLQLFANRTTEQWFLMTDVVNANEE